MSASFQVCLLLLLSGNIYWNPLAIRYSYTVFINVIKPINQRYISAIDLLWLQSCVNPTISMVAEYWEVFVNVCPSFYADSLAFADCSVLIVKSSLNASLLALSEPLNLSELFLPRNCTRPMLRLVHLNCRSFLACINFRILFWLLLL